MSQIQPAAIATNVISMRGVDVKSLPPSPTSTKFCTKTLEDFGLRDLVETWQKVKDRRSLDFCWRDILEYQIIKLDHARTQAVLCLEQGNVLRKIERANGRMWAWRPGFAQFTVEATTSRAYTPQLEDLLSIEQNFTRRRKYLRSLLNNDQAPFTLNILPDLDAGKPRPEEVLATSTKPETVPQKLLAHRRSMSAVIPSRSQDSVAQGNRSEPTSPTSRYPRLSRPRLRSIVTDSTIPQERRALEPHVFEAGSRGLQIIFGCHDLREARYLHDQMCVLSPIMLAFTASTPVLRGRLSEFDVRMSSASKSSSECRPGEKCSLARPWRSLYPTYLGVDAPRSRITRSTTNREVFQLLKMEGFDDAIAAFIAQGYSCTSLNIPKTIEPNGQHSHSTHSMPGFPQLAASLNPLVQLDLPSANDLHVGFRVTFNAMELQLTDTANAACIFFLALLRFAILGFDLDFRLPPHMVAENIAKAHREDSLLREKFWWRSVRWRVNEHGGFAFHTGTNDQPLSTDEEPTLVSIDHIVNGDPGRPETVGLSGVLDAYLADVEDGNDDGNYADPRNGAAARGRQASIAREMDAISISKYLAFIRRRAKGTISTDARLIRDFVKKHPEWSGEERIGEETDGEENDEAKVLSADVWYDLVKWIEQLSEGKAVCGNGKL